MNQSFHAESILARHHARTELFNKHALNKNAKFFIAYVHNLNQLTPSLMHSKFDSDELNAWMVCQQLQISKI
jgi:hypothetical protein